MGKNELKQKIHLLIDELEDEQALNMLYEDAVEYKTSSAEVGGNELSDEQWALIEKAKKEIDDGNYYSHEEVMQHLSQWKNSK